MKKFLFALVLAPVLFASCSKSDSPGNEFIINGIHDINMGTVGGNILALSVAQTSGTQQPVTITVTGLPAGMSADIQPASGTPAFASAITFSRTGNVVAGTYPIQIVGTSSSYTKSYDLNVVVPALNGFMIDGKTYGAANMTHRTVGSSPYYYSNIVVTSTDNGGGTFDASISDVLPSTDGTYTYKIGGYSSNSMSLSFSDNSSSGYYDNNYNDSSVSATLIISGGKYSLSIPSIKLYSGGGTGSSSKTLFVNAHE
jgi:hypothetical protein